MKGKMFMRGALLPDTVKRDKACSSGHYQGDGDENILWLSRPSLASKHVTSTQPLTHPLFLSIAALIYRGVCDQVRSGGCSQGDVL